MIFMGILVGSGGLNLWQIVVTGHKDYGPQMHTDEHRLEILNETTRQIIGAAFEVAKTLGAGFLEKVYERAMAEGLKLRGLRVQPQAVYSVKYKGKSVGEYLADLIVENRIIVELKCVDRFAPEHIAQCINYLKASGLKIALLINFQNPRVEWKRIING